MKLGLGDSLTELVAFVREQFDMDDLPQRVRAAVQSTEAKADKLRVKREAMRQRLMCPCGRGNRARGGVVCYACWLSAPRAMQIHLTNAKTDTVRREAARELIRFAQTKREEVAA